MLRRLTGREHVFLAPSARAAIAHILSALPHHEVVIPAYTCPVVKTACEVAQKRILYVDCAAGGLNATSVEFEPEARPGRVLVPTHIFGLPTDVQETCALARHRDCVTIEDAAAALGARIGTHLAGTVGDFGVFSFERSKRFPAFRGAAIVVNNERIVNPRVLESHHLATMNEALPAKEILFSFVYNLATMPAVYGRFTVHRLLRAHRSDSCRLQAESPASAMESPYYNRTFHPYQADLVLRSLNRSNILGAHIQSLVRLYKRVLAPTSVRTFVTARSDENALLRFPVAIPGVDRGEVLRRGLRSGLYLETNYERPLAPELHRSRFPNATWAAENVVLLPLYRSLSVKVAEGIARRVAEIAWETGVAERD
jgi:dTDP-4-amino-4,6-dideoxygalactose transaminase